MRSELQARTGTNFYIFYPAKDITNLEKFCLYSNVTDGSNINSITNDLFISRSRNVKKAIRVPIHQIKSLRLSMLFKERLQP